MINNLSLLFCSLNGTTCCIGYLWNDTQGRSISKYGLIFGQWFYILFYIIVNNLQSIYCQVVEQASPGKTVQHNVSFHSMDWTVSRDVTAVSKRGTMRKAAIDQLTI